MCVVVKYYQLVFNGLRFEPATDYVTFLFMRGKNMYLLNRKNLNAIPTRLLCIMLSVLTFHKVAKSEQI